MDPIMVVVTAVALGASAGLKDVAAQAVKDAYAGLKALLTRREVDVSGVERKPDSAAKQNSLREDLAELDGTSRQVDEQVLVAAREVIAAVKAHAPEAGAAIGIDLEELHAASLRISGVSATGTGVRGRAWTVEGDAVFENIRAGTSEPRPGSSGGAGGGAAGPPG